MCFSKSEEKSCFWTLEENKDAIRLNFSIKKVQECYVCADEESLILTNPRDEVEIWNLKSKIREKLIIINSDWNAISVSCTPGYLYLQINKGDITQFDAKTFEEVKVFQGQHRNAVAYIVITYDDKRLITFGWDAICNVWDIETG